MDIRLTTSLRSRTPAHTLAVARPLMQPLGISRVTDITRLDRLGLPVCASIRPRSRGLRVHAGKGLDTVDAMAGALMEALEFAVAERASAQPPDALLAVNDLLHQLPHGLQLADFAPRLGVPVRAGRRFDCMRCENLAGGGDVLLPAELVVRRTDSSNDGPALFGWSSNGLASGNSVAEAALHALFEVLERDTLALNRARDAAVRVADSSLPQPYGELSRRWRGLGVHLMVRHVPNAFDLPCFEACLHEPGSPDVNLAAGAGLHVDRDIALARAVCEAAQSRLGVIHGGRDDVTRFYAKYDTADDAARQAEEAGLLAPWINPGRCMSFDTAPHHATTAHSQDTLQWLLHRLSTLGFPAVFMRRLHASGIDMPDLHVVRLVVPRCEFTSHHGVRMGPRLLARALSVPSSRG